MTDFAAELKRCRNPKCRSKLSVPTDNPHKAFCARGCHTSFYLKRCIVCENDKPGGRSDRKFCRRPKCRSRYSRNTSFYVYPVPSIVRATDSSKSADKTGVKTALAGDRAWRIVAGPELSPSALHCATVPDGPDCQWTGGEYRRLDARARAALRAHFAKHVCLIQPHHSPVNILGGNKEWQDRHGNPILNIMGADLKIGTSKGTASADLTDTGVPDESPSKATLPIAHNLPIPDDLSIPDWLRA